MRKETTVQNITRDIVLDIIKSKNIKNTTLVQDLGINKSTVSLWVNKKLPLTRIHLTMFFYYFKSKNLL